MFIKNSNPKSVREAHVNEHPLIDESSEIQASSQWCWMHDYLVEAYSRDSLAVQSDSRH